MQTDPTGEHGSQLEDVFDDEVTTSAAAPVDPAAVDAISGAGAVAPTAPAPATEPEEIQMPPEWVGQGNPPRPQQVRDDIESKQHQAEALRQRSAQLTAQEQKLDADVDVANQLLAARTEEHRELQDRADALRAREAELVGDASRHDPDVNTAAEQVNAIKRQLGEKVPSDELMPPEGETPPAPVTVETDPARVAVLRQQLTDAQAKLDQALSERSGSDPELARIKAEQATLEPQLKAAEQALDTQKAGMEELKARAESLEADSVASLDQARGLEAEARNLTDALPDYQQVWDQWAAEHPDEAKVTDLGTLDVKVPPRETAALYAQGRREEAGRLEQQASDADKAAADAGNGAESRIELAQRNEQTAAELTQRAETQTSRAAELQRQAADASTQADKLGTDSDRLRSEAAQLRSQGRTDAADTMDARAKAMTDDSIKAQFRATDLERQAESLTQSSVTAQGQATELTKQSETLRTEATTLTTQQSELQQQATKLREDAASRDNIAQEIEDRLQTGQPFEFHLVDDRMGESIVLDVPAGPPPYSTDTADPTADTGAGAPDPSATGAAEDATATGADATAGGAASADADAGGGADALVAGDITGAAPAVSPDAATDTTDAAATDTTDAAATDTTDAAAAAAGDATGAGDEVPAASDPAPDAGDAFDAAAITPGFDDSGQSDFAPTDDASMSVPGASDDDGLDS